MTAAEKESFEKAASKAELQSVGLDSRTLEIRCAQRTTALAERGGYDPSRRTRPAPSLSAYKTDAPTKTRAALRMIRSGRLLECVFQGLFFQRKDCPIYVKGPDNNIASVPFNSSACVKCVYIARLRISR